jgi:hypothetical protein
MYIDILIATSCGVAGLLCGWMLYPAFNCPDGENTREEREIATSASLTAQTEELRATKERVLEIVHETIECLEAIPDGPVATAVDAQQIDAQQIDAWLDRLRRIQRTVSCERIALEPERELVQEIIAIRSIVEPEILPDEAPAIAPPTESPVDPAEVLPFEKMEVPRALQGLPRGAEVAADFGLLAEVPSAPGTTFITAVMKFDQRAGRGTKNTGNSRQQGQESMVATDLSKMAELARTVRSVLSPQDRIGLLDPTTIVVVMPHVDHESAILRADRIRSILCFEELESDEPNEGKSVSVSLCCSNLHNGFDSMLKTALANLKRTMANNANKTVTDWSEIFSAWH